MTTKFPLDLQKILDAAVLYPWDKCIPEPELSALIAWLEADGWDAVVISGLTCIYVSGIIDDLNDENLMEQTDIVNKKRITNSNRIAFARGHIEHLFSESMDSYHSISIDTKTMPCAALCFTMYYHPQGGATFDGLRVCPSSQDYLDGCNGQIIMNASDLSDSEILDLWKQSEAQLKSWQSLFL